jgi:hypothetical protein
MQGAVRRLRPAEARSTPGYYPPDRMSANLAFDGSILRSKVGHITQLNNAAAAAAITGCPVECAGRFG